MRSANSVEPEQQFEDQVDFLCELTASPKFVEGLRGTASMDMPLKARMSFRGQEAQAKETGWWEFEDEHARRLKAAYDEFAVPPMIAQNYIAFGREMDAILDEEAFALKTSATATELGLNES
jgi:hypothetical protein